MVAMLNAAVILGLILLNGFLSLSELAIVSSRRFRLEQLAGEGNRQAKRALALLDQPTHFLSTVQVGITLVGILAGALGGAALAEPLARLLDRIAWLEPYSGAISFGAVVVLITYGALVFGELVPKRVALHNPERIALRVAGPMTLLSRLTSPLVQLLAASTNAVLRVMPLKDSERAPVSEADIAGLLEQGTTAGVFEEAEQDIIENVFWFGDRPLHTLMTPRRDVAWLDLETSPDVLQARLSEHAHSYVVVSRGDLDEVEGIISSRDLLLAQLQGDTDPRALLQQPLFFPEAMSALAALEAFKESGAHLGLVVDEYGSVEGLLTLRDLLEALVGNIPTPQEMEAPKAVQRDEGSWLLDGLLPVDDFKELFDIGPFEDAPLEQHATLGGFVVAQLGHLPATAESFEWSGLHFEVVDMDGARVDKVLVAARPPADEGS